ncbi:MAG: hypothetical protein E7434_08580 [Ruminococcaceae bacterium]|nr:hypothetical protein [Oscillospiraceae bacterium]
MEKIKHYSMIIVFSLVIFAIAIAHIIIPDEKISTAERRELTQMPTLSAKTIFNGDYFAQLETYLLDQFPLRTTFQDAKKWIEQDVFLMKNSDGYAGAGGHLTKLDPSTNEADMNKAVSIFNQILQSHPEINDAYYAIIPDKNYYMYYLDPSSNQPTMNYDKLYEIMSGVDATQIDLREHLSLDDYYRTDSHWKQENILPVAEALCSAMGTQAATEYTSHSLEGFKGVYYELADEPPAPDTLTYLTNDAILNAKVLRLNESKTWRRIHVYNEAYFGAENTDSYDVFLEGAEMLITVENPNATSDKHLILFRDSFGSSLAPLLIDSYAKITIVDLRYIALTLIDDYVDFDNADVLFLYSATMLNTARSLN